MTSKTIAIVVGGAAVLVGGVYLYRKGKAQEGTTVARPGVAGTVKAGAAAVFADLSASRPSSGNPGTTTASRPEEAAADPRRTLTAPTHSRRVQRFFAPQVTWRDRFAQGLPV